MGRSIVLLTHPISLLTSPHLLPQIRKRLHELINSERFEYFMVVFILASCIELCFYDITLVPGSTKAKILFSCDILFLIVFGIEAILKIIHTGLLFNGQWSYLRNGWNILDACVIIAMTLILVLEGRVSSSQIVWLRALRAFRALRSMKVATKLDGMRAVVRSMGLAIPAVLEVLLVASLFYFIFSILGVNLLGGRLFFRISINHGVRLDFKTSQQAGITAPWILSSPFLPIKWKLLGAHTRRARQLPPIS